MNGFAGGHPLSDDRVKIIFIPRVGFLRGHSVHDCLAVVLQASAHVEDRHMMSLLDKCHSGRDGGRSGTYDDEHGELLACRSPSRFPADADVPMEGK